MLQQVNLADSFTMPGTSLTVNRIGYGAMQLAGPQVFGPPHDVDAAIAILREAVAFKVTCIERFAAPAASALCKAVKLLVLFHKVHDGSPIRRRGH